MTMEFQVLAYLQYKTYMTVVRFNLTLSWFFNNNITLDMKFGHKWAFDEI
jgi:hypothetical protein